MGKTLALALHSTDEDLCLHVIGSSTCNGPDKPSVSMTKESLALCPFST